MNFFRKLFGNGERPLSNASRKRILTQVLNPLLQKAGLNRFDGNYLWFSDFNQDGIRRVFKYSLAKGDMGLFTWGVCIKHIPTVSSSKRLQYHKNDKNIALHLWDWPEGYSISLEKDVEPKDLVAQSGEKQFRRDLQEMFFKHRIAMEEWYVKTDTLAGCLQVADDQINHGGTYSLRWPTPNYIKIFLLALLGDKDGARALLATRAQPASKGNADWRSVELEIQQAINSL